MVWGAPVPHVFEAGNSAQQFFAQRRVPSHGGEFIIVERAGFFQQGDGHAQFTDVVEQARHVYFVLAVPAVEPHQGASRMGHSGGVGGRIRTDGVDNQ